MKVYRREFFFYCTTSAAALGLASPLGPMTKALAASSGPPIIWLKGASCTGCTGSLQGYRTAFGHPYTPACGISVCLRQGCVTPSASDC